MPELLEEAVPLPENGFDVWGHFLKLKNEARGERISSSLMKDYEWSEGVELELWQRRAIKRIDTVFLSKGKSGD